VAYFPRMPLPAAVLGGILSASWRVVTLVLRDRMYVLSSSGDGKMVKDVVEIISAWNRSTFGLIQLFCRLNKKKNLLKRKIDYFGFSTLSSYSQLLSTPEVDEAHMQEGGIHWQLLISWLQNCHPSTSTSWRWKSGWHSPL